MQRSNSLSRARLSLLLALLALLATAALAAARAGADTSGDPDYSDAKSWLCLPGHEDACAVDLSTTIVAADGSLTKEAFKADPKAPIDCFYVYPTVSLDSTGNSDMNAGPEERSVVRSQFARFGSVCRTYAPLYRQITLTALRAGLSGGGQQVAVDRAMGYNDVVNAWNYYLEHYNDGRGVVLIGHSQGSGVLTQLIANEIDGKPIQKRLVSAILAGTRLQVPKGKDVGGAFQHVPLCHSPKDTGCAIAFASFRSNIPPPENSLFGLVRGDTIPACSNPAALGGGSGELHAYLSTRRTASGSSAAEPAPWVTPEKPIDTPFVSVPGLLSAKCVQNDTLSYLEITVHGDPSDPRVDDIAGDVVTNGEVQKNWGLHLIDVNLTIGNLIDLVRAQTAAYQAMH